jgi:hypothetical protein
MNENNNMITTIKLEVKCECKKCPLCGENDVVETKYTNDRCTECAINTCAKCGEESNGDWCTDCGLVVK